MRDFKSGASKFLSFHSVQRFWRVQRLLSRVSALLCKPSPMFQSLKFALPLRPRILNTLFLAASLLTLNACGMIYKQTIAQGNLLDQKSVDELSPGMSKRQVALILGTPAIQTPFQQDRWDYLYSYKSDGEPVQTKSLSLRFADGQLTVIEGDFKPGGKSVVFKPEDALIEATREYQRELKAAKKEREIAEEEVTTE